MLVHEIYEYFDSKLIYALLDFSKNLKGLKQD